MFFRFGVAITLIVVICVIGIAIEKRNLELRRDLSRQHASAEELLEAHARLRLKTQQLRATDRLMRDNPKPEEDSAETEHIRLGGSRTIPLLNWRNTERPR